MFKRALLISALTIGASLSFTPSFAATTGDITSFSGCTGSGCVAQAQSLEAEIAAMPAGPAKDKLLVALVKAIGAVAIANPDISVALGSVAESAVGGLSAAAAPAVPFAQQVVAALKAGTPGEATASLSDPGLSGPEDNDGPGDDAPGDDDGPGNSSAS